MSAHAPVLALAPFVIHRGCVLDVLPRMAKASVRAHSVVTSPPYWGLRDYGVPPTSWPAVSYSPMPGLPPVEIPAQVCCLGLESTPEAFVGHVVQVFREVAKVLREDGTAWVNFGDSYAVRWGSKRGRSALGQSDEDRGRGGAVPGSLKEKDLAGVPWRVAFALQADGWYLRSDIIWAKPNPMPESVTDRPTKAHEYLFLLSRRPSYFYDAEAVKEPAVRGYAGSRFDFGKTAGHQLGRASTAERADTTSRNRRSVWTVATRPFADCHFAVFPPELVEPCILAGTSARGCCPACGAPWRRKVERETVNLSNAALAGTAIQGKGHVSSQVRANHDIRNGPTSLSRTLGWEPGCACDAGEPVPCTVLDIFNGSGRTGVATLTHGRHYVGIELGESFADMTERDLRRVEPAPLSWLDDLAGGAL
ncbi:MAG TPA: site-specific DNA-methyltransferase [Longimicrobiaceae bacterium]|nr:site-specific DNA-methyltransferase [Longimicrobiaceae bacterium]